MERLEKLNKQDYPVIHQSQLENWIESILSRYEALDSSLRSVSNTYHVGLARVNNLREEF